jgi:hypothetical protein
MVNVLDPLGSVMLRLAGYASVPGSFLFQQMYLGRPRSSYGGFLQITIICSKKLNLVKSTLPARKAR